VPVLFIERGEEREREGRRGRGNHRQWPLMAAITQLRGENVGSGGGEETTFFGHGAVVGGAGSGAWHGARARRRVLRAGARGQHAGGGGSRERGEGPGGTHPSVYERGRGMGRDRLGPGVPERLGFG
jgi:hypothetical protein